MEVHIIDAYALIELPNVCLDLAATNKALARFTLEVEQGKLTFPTEVRDECRRFLGDDTCTVWVEAVAGSRQHIAYPYQMIKRALGLCSTLVDPDNPDPQAQAEVAAQACYILSTNADVVLVSNDFYSIDERTPLSEAAPMLGVAHASVQDYIRFLGHGDLVKPGL